MTATEGPAARADALDSARGWVLVALGVCILTTVWGVVFTFTVYANRLAAAFDFSPLQVSSVFSVTTAVFLVAGGVFGVVAARLPLRPVVATAGVGLAVVAVALQVVGSYVGVVATFVLLGMAGGTAFIVVVSVVPQWFDAYQGRAMGLTMTGNGFGVMLLPFVWLWLFDRVDFRTAFAVVVGAAAVVVLGSSLVYRRPPGRSGTPTVVDVAWLRTRLHDARFLGAAAGYAVLWGWYFVISSQLVDILTGNGIGVGGGFVGDRVGRREVFATAVALAAACVVVLPAIRSPLPLYVTLVAFGVGNGTLAALWSPIVLSSFGTENATATVGLLNLAMAGSAFLAPLGVGVLYGLTGGYAVPLVALGVVTVVGVVLFYWGTAPDTDE